MAGRAWCSGMDDTAPGRESSRPLIVACLAPEDLRPEVDPLSGDTTWDERRTDLSPPDRAALEYALRGRDAWGGRVVAVAGGPAGVEPSLREALALGAEVLRVPVPAPHDLAADPAAIAASLAAAIADFGSPDLVVCGDRSPSRGVGAVPAFLAHILGSTQALGLVSLDFAERPTILAERRLDGGWRERLRITAPAVCSVEAAGVRLRRAGLDDALAAAGAAIPAAVADGSFGGGSAGLVTAAPKPYRPRTKVIPAPAGTAHERFVALSGVLSSREPPRIVGPVGAKQAADELFAFLERRGYRQEG
jgi:electron transfer flavoprotein beta subunit